jgi:hypothetical protein
MLNIFYLFVFFLDGSFHGNSIWTNPVKSIYTGVDLFVLIRVRWYKGQKPSREVASKAPDRMSKAMAPPPLIGRLKKRKTSPAETINLMIRSGRPIFTFIIVVFDTTNFESK